MIGPAPGAKVMVATRPVDFRKGTDSLAALVAAEYGGKPYSGVIYVFRAKRADRIKLVWWDGTGLCLMAKRLEQGAFKWPRIQEGVMRLATPHRASTSSCRTLTWPENSAYVRLGDGCLKRRPYVSVAFAMSEWLEVLENHLDPHRLKVSGKDTGTHKIMPSAAI
jgi:transposase